VTVAVGFGAVLVQVFQEIGDIQDINETITVDISTVNAITDITLAIAIQIGLIRVVDGRAVITDIADTIGIVVDLGRIKAVGAVIANITKAVLIDIGLIVIGGLGAVIANVTTVIEVVIGLVGIGNGRAIIADVADIIEITVSLIIVKYGRAVIAGIAKPVTIDIGLIGIGNCRAIVEDIANIIHIIILAHGHRPALATLWPAHFRDDSIGVNISKEEIAGRWDKSAVNTEMAHPGHIAGHDSHRHQMFQGSGSKSKDSGESANQNRIRRDGVEIGLISNQAAGCIPAGMMPDKFVPHTGFRHDTDGGEISETIGYGEKIDHSTIIGPEDKTGIHAGEVNIIFDPYTNFVLQAGVDRIDRDGVADHNYIDIDDIGGLSRGTDEY